MTQNTPARSFKSNHLYRLPPVWVEFYKGETDGRFQLARSSDSAEGMWIADVWIVDEQGQRHPGYDAPTPHCIDDLIDL